MKTLSVGLKILSGFLMLGSVVRFFMSMTFMHFFSTFVVRGVVSKDQVPFLCVTFLVVVISCLILLINGIAGVMISSEPLLAHTAIKWGVSALVLCVTSNILQIIAGYGASGIYWITGAALPILFLIFDILFSILSKKGYRMKDKLLKNH